MNDAHDPTRRAVLAALAAGSATALAGHAAAPAGARKKRQPKPPPFEVARLGWRFCVKCRCLVYSPDAAPGGACPAGGKHSPFETAAYVLFAFADDERPAGTTGPFARCTKCDALALRGLGSGPCAEGGDHDPAAGDGVWLRTDPGMAGLTDDGWDYCVRCSAVFNWFLSNGICAAGGSHRRGDAFDLKLVWLR